MQYQFTLNGKPFGPKRDLYEAECIYAKVGHIFQGLEIKRVEDYVLKGAIGD